MAGELYDCHSPEFLEGKARATDWMQRYNALPYSERGKRYGMLKEQLGSVGTNVSVADGIIIGFGQNIHIGNNVSINYRCILQRLQLYPHRQRCAHCSRCADEYRLASRQHGGASDQGLGSLVGRIPLAHLLQCDLLGNERL